MRHETFADELKESCRMGNVIIVVYDILGDNILREIGKVAEDEKIEFSFFF